MSNNMPSQYAIAMFAYNEEKNISRSVKSVFENTDERLSCFYVIANGCSDRTVEILKEIENGQGGEKLEIVDLEIGDKCNAWNVYMHDIANEVAVHFFVDADVSFTKNAFPIMFETLLSKQGAHAIAGLPCSGRNIEYYRSLVKDRACLFGNCYGVKYEFIKLLKDNNQRLPIGLNWIDSAITKFVNTDIGVTNNNIPGRVVYNPNAGYRFASLKPYVLNDIKLYFNRIARYKLGKLQERYLDQMSFSEWPRELAAINMQIKDDIDEGHSKVPFYLKHLVYCRLNKSLGKL